MSKFKKAVVLVSGGLDSATVLAMAKSQGFECYALSMDYGQRHRVELERAQKVSQSNGAVEHRVVQIDIGGFGGSALTDQDISVPTQETEEIPVTYVPARNTVFLSVALGWAEVLGASAIFIGANAVDYSGYPDCRPEYIEAFQKNPLHIIMGTFFADVPARRSRAKKSLLIRRDMFAQGSTSHPGNYPISLACSSRNPHLSGLLQEQTLEIPARYRGTVSFP